MSSNSGVDASRLPAPGTSMGTATPTAFVSTTVGHLRARDSFAKGALPSSSTVSTPSCAAPVRRRPRRCHLRCAERPQSNESSPLSSLQLPHSEGLLRTAGRVLAGVCVAGLVSGAVSAPPVGAYGLENGRLAKCKGDAPCVSTTSVGNPSKFGPPWSYRPETDDAGAAWASLKHAVETSEDNGRIVEVVDGPSEYYLRAEFPSAFDRGTDDVEFRLIPADALVTYRSASRDAFFIYPIQTPIDTNKNKKRLESIRAVLGWEEFAGEELYTAK